MNSLPIPGYPGYRVFENGVIMNNRGTPLKPSNRPDGYSQVGLCVNNTVKNLYVHRLVALHLGLDLLDLNTQVNHKDTDKSNNKLSNLELTDSSGNMSHIRAINTLKALGPPNSPLEKVCRSCKESKNKSLFGTLKASKDGLSSYCKHCANTLYPKKERNAK